MTQPIYVMLNYVIGDKRETIFYDEGFKVLGRTMLNDAQLSYISNFVKRVSPLTVYNQTGGHMSN